MDPTQLTLEEAANALRKGDVSAQTYARSLLDRAEKFASLNAFI